MYQVYLVLLKKPLWSLTMGGCRLTFSFSRMLTGSLRKFFFKLSMILNGKSMSGCVGATFQNYFCFVRFSSTLYSECALSPEPSACVFLLTFSPLQMQFLSFYRPCLHSLTPCLATAMKFLSWKWDKSLHKLNRIVNSFFSIHAV